MEKVKKLINFCSMKYTLLVFCCLFFLASVKAQDHNWAFGFYGDVQLEDASYDASFGVQGKYDIGNFQALQAQVHGRGDFVGVGADYLVNLLNKRKSNFNVFLGGGFSQEFYTYDYTLVNDEEHTIQSKENFSIANGQAGLSYYFAPVQLSVYAGYKLKYQFKNELVDPNYLMFGLRYHIW